MYKSRKVLRGIAIIILLISTIYVVYSILSSPFDTDVTMQALATCAGFIALDSNKNKEKSK